jgi:hypothetical protein
MRVRINEPGRDPSAAGDRVAVTARPGEGQQPVDDPRIALGLVGQEDTTQVKSHPARLAVAYGEVDGVITRSSLTRGGNLVLSDGLAPQATLGLRTGGVAVAPSAIVDTEQDRLRAELTEVFERSVPHRRGPHVPRPAGVP